MSLDVLFTRAAREKLTISTLGQGTHGRWHSYVRLKTKLHGVGFGATAEEALSLAISGNNYIERPAEPPAKPASQFEDLLG